MIPHTMSQTPLRSLLKYSCQAGSVPHLISNFTSLWRTSAFKTSEEHSDSNSSEQ